MSRTFSRMVGGGSGGVYQQDDYFTVADANQAKHDIDIVALATFYRSLRMGGSREFAYTVNSDADYDLKDWDPVPIDNTNTQLSGFTDANGASLVKQVRFLVRVSNATISATPKLRYGSAFSDISAAGAGTVATISGAAACSATTEDFSGTNSYQTVTLTLPTGVTYWKPQITISGTGGVAYEFWAVALLDLYIQST